MKTKKTEIADRVIRKNIEGEDGHTYRIEMYENAFKHGDSGKKRVKKIVIDNMALEQIKAMAMIQLPKKYIAQILGMDRKVFEKLLSTNEAINRSYHLGVANGINNVSIKAYQMASGKFSNSQMVLSFLERAGVIEKEPRHHKIFEQDQNNGYVVKHLSGMNFAERLAQMQKNVELMKSISLEERDEEIKEKEKKVSQIMDVNKDAAE